MWLCNGMLKISFTELKDEWIGVSHDEDKGIAN